ncbi:uncharacterized protein EV420DRAFT_1581841 [Desarmillaria tabescens]|uniref:F-box domain-containing protein n=1 Tax=Armillaria tabescens TaxID=1929756 RepID=A0AA39MMN2_ARMTA|nr:uncharacterized protein EV420DRAFT_1581841 [Desarmillaria tabescens]KAK0440416.1 hypothetical protein EV420DRAFT_1581841 [Desarmillaria tabescens]
MSPRPPSLTFSTSYKCSLHSNPDIPESISDNPRIKALLECNDSPLEIERVSLLATEAESSGLLVILKEKINNVQQMLNILLDGQTKVTENLQAAKTLLHPIRSIPDDVLCHIFSFCVHEVYDLLDEDAVHNSLDSRKPPWTLSQVCRSWRRVTLSTASLWRCLSLDFERYREPGNVHLSQFMLGLHIQGARQHQLTIRISSIKDISSHAFIPILLASIPYWKNLRACIPTKSFEVFLTYRGYLESLHYLKVRRALQDKATSPIRIFEMAQSVRVLDISSGLCSGICLPDNGKGLTNLTIHGRFVKCMFSLLGNTPNIEILGVYFQASKPFERLNTPIMMPKVTALAISEWDGAAPSSIAHLFESLELPALSFLQLCLDNEDSDSTVFVFPEILSHHHCREIRQVEVTAPRSKVGKAGLVDILTCTINLEHLSVAAEVVDKDLLSALTRSNGNERILPKLFTFDLRGSESIASYEILLQVAESRRKDEIEPSRQEEALEMGILEELYLDEPLTFDDVSLASRWQALQSDGLIVNYG